MSKLIYEMDTDEILKYLKRERFLHGLFYVERERVMSTFDIEISDDDWLGFANFYTEGFNRHNDFFLGGEDEVIEDWKMDKYQYGQSLITDPEKYS